MNPTCTSVSAPIRNPGFQPKKRAKMKLAWNLYLELFLIRTAVLRYFKARHDEETRDPNLR